MTKAWCIVGLPGSGKTILADRLAYDLEQPHIVDDIQAISQLPEDGVFTDVIVIDPYFCVGTIREQAHAILVAKYDEVVWIFFENNVEKCIVNVRHRNDGRKVEGLIRFLSQAYQIPDQTSGLPGGLVELDVRLIWQPEDDWR